MPLPRWPWFRGILTGRFVLFMFPSAFPRPRTVPAAALSIKFRGLFAATPFLRVPLRTCYRRLFARSVGTLFTEILGSYAAALLAPFV